MGILARFVALYFIFCVPGAAWAAWEPETPVEFVVPAIAGSGLDQMARLIQDIIIKHTLMKQRLTVVNKPGGAGVEGFLLIKNDNPEALKAQVVEGKVEPYRFMIAGNSMLISPLMTGAPFKWTDVTPVVMIALEPYILWTRAEGDYKSAKDYIAAAKAAGPGKMKMAGISSRQDPQLITFFIERASGVKFSYIPFKGARESFQLGVGEQMDSRVMTPNEAVSRWRAGELTAQCVFENVRLPYTTKVTDRQSWSDIPTCKEAEIPVEYHAFRSIHLRPKATAEEIAYFTEVVRKVSLTQEWKDYMEKGAFTPLFLTGSVLNERFGKTEKFYQNLVDCAFTIWELRSPPPCSVDPLR